MSGLFQAVAENAISQAEELEGDAERLRAKADDNIRRAQALRAMHAVAIEFAKPAVLLALPKTEAA